MKKTIIAINGPIKSGKSTIANLLYRNLHNAMIIPFAGVPKRCIEEITGVSMDERQPDGSYDYSHKAKEKTLPSGMKLGRFIMEFAESVRAIDRKIWADAAIRYVLENNRDYYIMPDLRFIEEIDQLNRLADTDDYNILFVRISPAPDLTEANKVNDGRDINHLGETGLNDYIFDSVYTNRLGMSNANRIASLIENELRSI